MVTLKRQPMLSFELEFQFPQKLYWGIFEFEDYYPVEINIDNILASKDIKLFFEIIISKVLLVIVSASSLASMRQELLPIELRLVKRVLFL